MTNALFILNRPRSKPPKDLKAWVGIDSNCVVNLLTEKFKSKSDKLKAIKLNKDSSWGLIQTIEASKILKKNIILINAVGGIVYEYGNHSSRDGENAPVEIIVANRHAISKIPEKPRKVELSLIPEFDIDSLYENITSDEMIIFPCGKNSFVAEDGKLYRDQEEYNNLKSYAEKIEFNGDVKYIQTEFGIEFAKWKEEQNICRMQNFNKQWKESQLFSLSYI